MILGLLVKEACLGPIYIPGHRHCHTARAIRASKAEQYGMEKRDQCPLLNFGKWRKFLDSKLKYRSESITSPNYFLKIIRVLRKSLQVSSF